jgi:ribonuclease BN (tRNA processing enzyme)
MKLTVLGCWAPYPKAGGACSGYLLQAGGKNILIECGNGTLSNLQKHIDFRQLDAVLISHFHPDHYMDLYCLRHAVSGARRANHQLQPVTLYLPGSPELPHQQMSGYTDSFTVKTIETLPAEKENGVTVYKTLLVDSKTSGKLNITFIYADHPIPAYAMLIEGEKKFFYSADTKLCLHLPAFMQGVDVALCEASVIEEDKDYTSVGHLTAMQAGQLAREAGVKNLVITHFWPEYDLETIKAEAEYGFGRPVTVAYEGLVVKI